AARPLRHLRSLGHLEPASKRQREARPALGASPGGALTVTESMPRACYRGALIAVACAALMARPAAAEEPSRAPGVFFGAGAGVGAAWIDHADVDPDARPGATLDLVFGWVVSP